MDTRVRRGKTDNILTICWQKADDALFDLAWLHEESWRWYPEHLSQRPN